jgi:branched-subunit amino acid transport protein
MIFLGRLLHLLFLFPLQVVLFHKFVFFRRALVTALIMDGLCFLDHEAPSLETTRDDILAGSPAPVDITISGSCTDLVVVGSCAFLVFGC